MVATTASASDLFVDANLTTGANDGSSWADAFQGTDGLASALQAAVPGDRVFVAQGTYRPTANGNRNASFRLNDDIALYGGCIGIESDPSERPARGTAPSILTGDLNGDDPASLLDNSFSVVQARGVLPTAVLDRFVVSGGYANQATTAQKTGAGLYGHAFSQATIRECRFEGNTAIRNGGGVNLHTQSRPSFFDCSFVGNSSGRFGGGLCIGFADGVRVERCEFRGNVALHGGGVGLNYPRGATLTDCTFFGNVATGGRGGGAIASTENVMATIRGCTIVGNTASATVCGGVQAKNPSTITIRNSIIWGNQGSSSTETFQSQVRNVPMSAIRYSIVEGISGGAGNLDTDPLLVDAMGGDLRLTLGSPAIDAGNNGDVILPPNGALALDHGGFRRFVDEPTVPDTGVGSAPIVDIGAFEFTTVLGRPYCAGGITSTGVPARIDALGSAAVADNTFTLLATDVPPGVYGFFLTSRRPGAIQLPFNLTLCLSGDIGRFDRPGEIMQASPSGEFSLSVDLTMQPTPTGPAAVLVGETWHYQTWFRDSFFGQPVSSVSDAIAVTFE